MARYALRLPESTKKAAEDLAARDGVSLNQFIATAVAEKVAVMNDAEAYFIKRAEQARPGAAAETLAKAGSEPPREGDEI